MDLLQASPTFGGLATPSPNGRFVAVLQNGLVLVQSLQSLETLYQHPLPEPQNGGPPNHEPHKTFIQWSPSSRCFAVVGRDQVTLLGVLSPHDLHVTLHATASHVVFATDRDVCLVHPHGLHITLVHIALASGGANSSTTTTTTTRIVHPKLLGRGGLALHPQTGHLALLTRVHGRDIVSLHAPRSGQLAASLPLSTTDAQGLAWTADGRWLVVWDSPAYGTRCDFYTPDGHLFYTYTGRPTDQGQDDLGPGPLAYQLSPDGHRLAVLQNSVVTLLDADTATPLLPSPLSTTPSVVWQQHREDATWADLAFESQTPAHWTQPDGPSQAQPQAQPPSQPPSGQGLVAFNSNSSRLAVRKEDRVWVWTLDVPSPSDVSPSGSPSRARPPVVLLVFLHPVTRIQWHAHHPDLLLVACRSSSDAVDSLFVWTPAFAGPRPLHGTLLETSLGRADHKGLRATWLALRPDEEEEDTTTADLHAFTVTGGASENASACLLLQTDQHYTAVSITSDWIEDMAGASKPRLRDKKGRAREHSPGADSTADSARSGVHKSDKSSKSTKSGKSGKLPSSSHARFRPVHVSEADRAIADDTFRLAF